MLVRRTGGGSTALNVARATSDCWKVKPPAFRHAITATSDEGAPLATSNGNWKLSPLVINVPLTHVGAVAVGLPKLYRKNTFAPGIAGPTALGRSAQPAPSHVGVLNEMFEP